MTEENKPFGIKQWAEDDRPREKLLLKGRHSLSDAELIAILIATGTKEESAVDLGKKILAAANNNLNDLAQLNIKDLKKIKGIGEAKAISIVAALELGRRRKNTTTEEKPLLNSSKRIFETILPYLQDLPHEEFWVLLLNNRLQLLAAKRVSGGGITSTIVDPKIVFKMAIDHLATNIVLCHNHPSGNKQPSHADFSLTKKMIESGRMLEIAIVEHIIVAGDTYYSFADDGKMQ